MADPVATLEFTSVGYWSPGDETSFFAWLDRIDCVSSYRGASRTLFVDLKTDQPSEDDLRELIGLHQRYKIDMRQLARFRSSRNESWFALPSMYWFDAVFGASEETTTDA